MMRATNILVTVLVAFLLTACGAQMTFRDGKRDYDAGHVEDGLAKMDKAYKLDPDSSEYRIEYIKRREATVFQWLLLADAAKTKGAWDEAENYYRRILKIDPENPRAKTGLGALATEKRQALLLEEAKSQLEKNDLKAASKSVRQVLSESPSQPAALKLRKEIDAKMAAASKTGSVLKTKLSRPITIEFKDASLQGVFDSISKVAGINFIFDKEIRPDLRANLVVRDARIEDVIRFVLFTNQLEQRVLNSNTLFIYPNTPQKVKDFKELQVRNFYLTNASAKDVAAILKGVVKPHDIYVDDKLNLIVVRDTPEAIRAAERLIAAQDIPEPEVTLDVEVLEVGTNLLDTIGIQYPSQLSYGVVGAAGTPGAVTLPEFLNRNAGLVRMTISDPALIINMLHQDGDTNLLANPKIRVKNHEKATVHIGDKVPVITNTTTATGLVSQSISYLDVGLKLDAEPTVYLDNDVGIKIGLEVSSITKQIQNTSGSLTYQIGTRTANTVLRLKDGETQMLAGLIDKEDRKTANRVPVLGQLPIVGHLFSNSTDTATKTEVVLLITPHVVRNIVPPDTPVEEFTSGTDTQIGLEPLEINQAESDKAGPVSLAAPKDNMVAANSVSSDVAGDMPMKQGGAAPVPALGSVKLSLDAPPQAQAGTEFTVKVNVAADGLQNTMLNLSYDPAKLKVVSVAEGDLLKKPDGKTQFMQQIQDKAGRINLGVSRQGNVQGEGMLARVTFQTASGVSGPTQVRVDAANFSDAAGRVVPFDAMPVANIGIIK